MKEKEVQGLPWRYRGYGSALPLQGPLVGKLRSYVPRGVAKKKEVHTTTSLCLFTLTFLLVTNWERQPHIFLGRVTALRLWGMETPPQPNFGLSWEGAWPPLRLGNLGGRASFRCYLFQCCCHMARITVLIFEAPGSAIGGSPHSFSLRRSGEELILP